MPEQIDFNNGMSRKTFTFSSKNTKSQPNFLQFVAETRAKMFLDLFRFYEVYYHKSNNNIGRLRAKNNVSILCTLWFSFNEVLTLYQTKHHIQSNFVDPFVDVFIKLFQYDKLLLMSIWLFFVFFVCVQYFMAYQFNTDNSILLDDILVIGRQVASMDFRSILFRSGFRSIPDQYRLKLDRFLSKLNRKKLLKSSLISSYIANMTFIMGRKSWLFLDNVHYF